MGFIPEKSVEILKLKRTKVEIRIAPSFPVLTTYLHQNKKTVKGILIEKNFVSGLEESFSSLPFSRKINYFDNLFTQVGRYKYQKLLFLLKSWSTGELEALTEMK